MSFNQHDSLSCLFWVLANRRAHIAWFVMYYIRRLSGILNRELEWIDNSSAAGRWRDVITQTQPLHAPQSQQPWIANVDTDRFCLCILYMA